MGEILLLLRDDKTVLLNLRSFSADMYAVHDELKDELCACDVRRKITISGRGRIGPVAGTGTKGIEWLYRVSILGVTEAELAWIKLIMGEHITSILHSYSDGFLSIHHAPISGRSELDLYDPRQDFLGTVYRDRETKELMFRSGGVTEPLTEAKWETLHDEVIDGGVAR